MIVAPEGQIIEMTSVNTVEADEHVSSGVVPTYSGAESVPKFDIEHACVEDDPRTWSNTRKNIILVIITAASVIAGLSSNIQNPANSQIELDLHSIASEISLSLSLSILVQGNSPLVWSTISEIRGRKFVYLFSLILFTVGSAIVAVSKTISLFIAMRVIQAAGTGVAVTIGGATLADIYEPHQRGSKMGIFYSGPVLGPAIGAVLGGVLTQGFGWRAVFWFLMMWGGILLSAFLFLFKDTFRRERSFAYQNALKERVQGCTLAKEEGSIRGGQHASEESSKDATCGAQTPKGDVETQSKIIPTLAFQEVKLSVVDVNPIPPYLRILSRMNNVLILLSSGLIFGLSYSTTYTCARTLSLYYKCDALTTGLVLLSYGIGSILGSVLGGKWSDRALARAEATDDGVSYPEMRLESTKLGMCMLPPAVLGYAWVCQQHVHIAAICVMLFLSGFCTIWIYVSALAYIVDANVGQSSSAGAANASFRGIAAFIAAEIAVPLQDAIGDGGLYTLWAGLMLLMDLMIFLVLYKGKQWREASIETEKKKWGS